MTISTTNSSQTFAGNGATTVFSYNFVADSPSTMEVLFTDSSGNQVVLNPSLYTLVINPVAPGQLWGVGGTVTYPIVGSPIAVGTSLTVQRIVPYTQTVSIQNQGPFYPQAVEQALDIIVMELQQVENTIANITSSGNGTVTDVGVLTSSLNVSGSPITTSGNISIDLPTVNSRTFLGSASGMNTAGPVQLVAGGNITLTPGAGNLTITSTGSGGGTGNGTVTNIGVTSSSLAVSGSPVTTVGNIAVNLPSIGNGTILANYSGGVATPVATILVAGPHITLTPGTGNLTIGTTGVGNVTSVGVNSSSLSVSNSPITSSGNINISLPTIGNNSVLGNFGNGGNATAQQITFIAGNNVVFTPGSGNVTISAIGNGTGNVTSVGVTTSSLAVSGSPITSSGNISVNLPTIAGNTTLLGTSNTGNVTAGGVKLVAGLNVSIVPGAGNITISAVGNGSSGGTVTDVSIGTSSLATSGSPVVTSGTIQVDLPVVGNSTVLGNFAGGNATAAPVTLVAGGNTTFTPGSGNLTISSVGNGTVQSISISSSTLATSGSPVTTSGTIDVELPVIGNSTVLGNFGGPAATAAPIILVPGTNVSFTPGIGNLTINATGGGGNGTISSVGINTASLTISGSPLTTSGNITVNLPMQGNSTILGNFGGTTTAAKPINLIAGSNVSFASNSGNLTISSSNPGGTVTSVGVSSSSLSISGSPVTGSGTITANLPTVSSLQVLGASTGPTTASAISLVAGSNVTLTPGAGSITIAASGGGGYLGNQNMTFTGDGQTITMSDSVTQAQVIGNSGHTSCFIKLKATPTAGEVIYLSSIANVDITIIPNGGQSMNTYNGGASQFQYTQLIWNESSGTWNGVIF